MRFTPDRPLKIWLMRASSKQQKIYVKLYNKLALYLATLIHEKRIVLCDDISAPTADLGTRSFGFLPNDRKQRKKMLL
jgi:hypothetical protein